jgi:hypothetical protein
MLGCALAEENRSGGLCESSMAGLALVTLNASPGPAILANIPLCLTVLKLPVVRTGFVWTKISAFGKLLHLSPSRLFAMVYSTCYQRSRGRLSGT